MNALNLRKIGMTLLTITVVYGTAAWAGPGDISTAAGDGTSSSAGLRAPMGMKFNWLGHLLIADAANDQIKIVYPGGNYVETVVGNGIPGYAGDGGLAIFAQLYNPRVVITDKALNLYISDTFNHRVRRVDGTTNIITTIAGNGASGSLGDGGLAVLARLTSPQGLALDSAGNLLIADPGTSSIRRVDTAGHITTIAGIPLTPSYSGDGGLAVNAGLNNPTDIAFDQAGNLLIVDEANNRIRRVDQATGIITTIAGNGTAASTGDGGLATAASLDYPNYIALDNAGNIFITEVLGHRVRRIDYITGIITTVAGNGQSGYTGDGMAATNTRLYLPEGIAFNSNNDFFIADSGNIRIRKVFALIAPGTFTVSPNSGSTTGGTSITIDGTNFGSGATVQIDGVDATSVVHASDNQLTAVTPAGTKGTKNVTVTNPENQRTALTNGFTYIAPPHISNVTPTSGSTLGGTSLLISGSDFSLGATVKIDGVAATSIVVLNDSQITAVTPAGTAGSKDIVVTNSDGQMATLTGAFTYLIIPGSFVVSPNSGPTVGGTTITISGSDFVSGATVKVGGVNANFVVFVNASQLTARTPAGAAGSKDVVVTNPNGQTSTLSNGFTYIAPPGDLSITPNSGSTVGGTAITIEGTNFVDGATVQIGGANATSVVVVSASQLTALSPINTAGSKHIVVINPDGQIATLANGFTYIAPPGSFTMTPDVGPAAGGTTVTINGFDFMPGATLKIGGKEATSVGYVSDTQLIAVTPAGVPGAQDVVVTNPDGQIVMRSGGFTYAVLTSQLSSTPAINIFDPSNGGYGEISYELSQSEHVTIDIYDRKGDHVITLLDETRGPGAHIEKWYGRNDVNSAVTSGYYNVLMKLGSTVKKLKMIVAK